MMSRAISCWSRKPSLTAMGIKIVVSTISLQQAATRVGASFLMALAPSNEAPMESSASGVVRLERLVRVFCAG